MRKRNFTYFRRKTKEIQSKFSYIQKESSAKQSKESEAKTKNKQKKEKEGTYRKNKYAKESKKAIVCMTPITMDAKRQKKKKNEIKFIKDEI